VYDLSKAQAISQMMIAIDIKAFLPFEQYLAHVEEFRLGIKNSSKAEGTKEIFLPGEIELRKQRETLSSGSISIPDNVIAELNQLAKEGGIATLLDSAISAAHGSL
jgi:LDH2 family malate/lactate/ureidoglycolate dehydrogenase